MAGRLSRGWSMAKASFAVLKQYPKLAILPAMSGAIFLLIAGAILASLMPQLRLCARSQPARSGTGSATGNPRNILFYAVRLCRALCH